MTPSPLNIEAQPPAVKMAGLVIVIVPGALFVVLLAFLIWRLTHLQEWLRRHGERRRIHRSSAAAESYAKTLRERRAGRGT